jgi:hypothetical protein
MTDRPALARKINDALIEGFLANGRAERSLETIERVLAEHETRRTVLDRDALAQRLVEALELAEDGIDGQHIFARVLAEHETARTLLPTIDQLDKQIAMEDAVAGIQQALHIEFDGQESGDLVSDFGVFLDHHKAKEQQLDAAEARCAQVRAVFQSIDAWCHNDEGLLTEDVCEWRDALATALGIVEAHDGSGGKQ